MDIKPNIGHVESLIILNTFKIKKMIMLTKII